MEEIKQMEKATQDINRLISDLQVYGYKVTINNYCIGYYHNVYIRQYKPIKNKILQFFFRDDLYTLETVYSDQIRLPVDVEKIKTVMNDLLTKAKQSHA